MKDDNDKETPFTEDIKTALHYMTTLVDVARESFLILDADLRVITANPIFYDTFQVTKKETENMLLYNLGNGQWDIPELKNLLEKILPEKKVVRDYEVFHVFKTIGERTMILNARQIDSVRLIILAIEDISVRKNLEKKLAEYTEGLEGKIVERTGEISDKNKVLEKMNKFMVGRELKMIEQKKEIADLKKSK
ncbi:hypothetical protein A3A93_01395 [Candidatus Roizmanbacteria bacterium RIFCSPLOWO2_01_FULL_38_12]|uniref:PAS fold-4 domain-containing protein n=1 Tax=Candidatus Roizmanbacteria bacterium RIFCSPLOWO2_01_FULL_38_12 TaxID=1802061 RepID=A0A1F7IY36_9BACT|nr:MAG: hypothetical protein A2861_00695 [Candidatus Roizmanbacteria bacterium RIFCSPHIGHO2_01_FULL_38_15]OGK34450.1 MAG: hypothetical protein A3F59_03925 [Candidatus Roizmanbacteria bacterium RIFCSPHIGHO2_12_FULL_38_13]OGK48280.1 MAG: hypothetical protein A3A93_01395 [Candidatus Roizmanbacteria bacterium RIFCSPLOWO2_01_FULL_38_12]